MIERIFLGRICVMFCIKKHVTIFLFYCLCVFPVRASHQGLIDIYVPTCAGESDTISIKKLQFLTWWSSPESNISGVLWIYVPNTPHNNIIRTNVNVASQLRLSISLNWKQKEPSVVTLDVSQMKKGLFSKDETIKALIKATEMNLKEVKVSDCLFVVKGLEKQPELKAVVFPKILNASVPNKE